MTADRIQYFEERLKKPIPEPFKSWMEELFAEAKGAKPTASKSVDGKKPDFKGSFYTPQGEHKPAKRQAEPEPTPE